MPNLEAAQDYVFERMKKELPADLYYHGIHHTKDHVLPAIEEFSKSSKIGEEEFLLVFTGGLYHDIGYIERYFQNETIGARIAEETLPKFGYRPEQIRTILGIILATQIPQRPAGLLQQIMCDADLTSLGLSNFLEITDSLRREFLTYGVIKPMSDKEWYEFELNFLEGHSYFTDAARRLRGENKQRNIENLKRLIES